MFWVWVAIEPLAKIILVGIRISLERTMLLLLKDFLRIQLENMIWKTSTFNRHDGGGTT